MVSEKTILWRQKYASFIRKWQDIVLDLRLRMTQESWSNDKLEMEILQKIENQRIKNVFSFTKDYIYHNKKGSFRNFMYEVYLEIINFGVIEPGRLYAIEKAIVSAKKKMKWKDQKN